MPCTQIVARITYDTVNSLLRVIKYLKNSMAVRYERLKQNKEIDLQDFEYTYDMFTEEDERITELKRIVSELPEPQRRVILIYASTASLKKVADLLNVSQPTIATMVNEIRQKIYKQYGKSHF